MLRIHPLHVRGKSCRRFSSDLAHLSSPDATANGHLKPWQMGWEPFRTPVGIKVDTAHLDSARAAPKAENSVAGQQRLEDLAKTVATPPSRIDPTLTVVKRDADGILVVVDA